MPLPAPSVSGCQATSPRQQVHEAPVPERDRVTLNLRFVAGWSQTQIGLFIGATQMQVSRMLARSLAQLRSWSEPERA